MHAKLFFILSRKIRLENRGAWPSGIKKTSSGGGERRKGGGTLKWTTKTAQQKEIGEAHGAARPVPEFPKLEETFPPASRPNPVFSFSSIHLLGARARECTFVARCSAVFH